jgi:transcription antitermination factor NusG
VLCRNGVAQLDEARLSWRPHFFLDDVPRRAAPQNELPLSFRIGEQVRILAGPFASFAGVVAEIDDANSRMKVAVSIFGPAGASRVRI